MTPPAEPAAPDEKAEVAVPGAIRKRLSNITTRDPSSWVWTAVVALIAAAIRLIGLTSPKGKIFDELYYATDAHNLLIHGVEWDDKNNTAGFVVHPPLGKWAIALGEKIFGYNELGWRISSVVAGVAAVVIVTRLGRRLFGSTALGCAAGLLMALDGFQFVLSRTALLDIFLLTFVIASFACLIADRDWRQRRWLEALEAGLRRPVFSMPWWRLGSAVLIGCALAVKWSALWYLLGFLVMLFVWELRIQRGAGQKHPVAEGFLYWVRWAFAYGFTAVVVYVMSWTGWLAGDSGYNRHWLRVNGRSEWPILGALYNLARYHYDALNFHVGLSSSHPYESSPIQWLLLSRPVAFHYSSPGGCGADQCSSEVLLLGTPLLWWSFIPAMLALVWFGISRRDWRAWPILTGALLGIFPWFVFNDRTMFYFYAAPAEPFLILTVVYVFGAIIGSGAVNSRRRTIGSIALGMYVTAVAACFVYFYPIYTGKLITFAAWTARIWLGKQWT
ncbi:MAG: phospholipid carrier-dependent glycosyltransferase [Longispora sp.]|nr:phospholipid carrier-dependent glycosyltransferase [Longispora sp. (in: high G+C Gram-positive bacteria)]